jgi:hypothetical protein
LAPLRFAEAAAPPITKSSIFFPDLIAAVKQRGFKPRPAQVSAGVLQHLRGASVPFVFANAN